MPMEQTPPPMDMPPMGNNDMGGDFMPDGSMQQPPMNDGMNSQFDTNFDAGVEASEEDDPKKYIQQLTGKLSQTLRKYNENNGQPDVDLNKYVAGMVVKQAMEGLSQDDADEIIDKVKSDEDFQMDDNGQGGEMEQMPQDDKQMMNDPSQGQMPMGQMDESRRHNTQIKEIVNSVLDGFKNGNQTNIHKASNDKRGFRKKPFMSPNFEK